MSSLTTCHKIEYETDTTANQMCKLYNTVFEMHAIEVLLLISL